MSDKTKLKDNDGLAGLAAKAVNVIENETKKDEQHRRSDTTPMNDMMEDLMDEDNDLWDDVDVDMATALDPAISEGPLYQRFRDKVTFFLGVANLCVLAFCAGGHGIALIYFYTFKFFTLLPLRVVEYWNENVYFLLDFCYFANILLFIYLWFLPTSQIAFIMAFGVCNGPLLWAVPLFRNSLVFHSLGKIISAFIHISPALVIFVIRWYSTVQYGDFDFQPSLEGWNSSVPDPNDHAGYAGVGPMILLPCGFFFAHSILYYILGYLNQFVYMAKSVPMLKPLAKLPPWQGQLVYAALQNIMTIVMILPTYLLYRTFWLHFVLICLIISACIWNGANFYVEVFARKYKGWTKKDILKSRKTIETV